MFKFAREVFTGLFEAFKTDVNVFLIGCAASALSFRKTRGIGASLLFYISLRRIDDLMAAYVAIKNRELSLTSD